VAQGPNERTFGKEIESVQSLPHLLPVLFELVALSFEKDFLECFVEFADRLLFGDPDVTLQPLHNCAPSVGYSVREFCLAAPGRSLDEKWLLHPDSEVNDGQRDRIDDVSRSAQLLREFLDG
jgi:hypothetical protein